MSGKLKKVWALLLAFSMVLPLAACGSKGEETSNTESISGNTENASSSAENKELTKITLYPAAGNIPSGVIGGWKGDYFASLGFQVEVWAYSDEKTNAILASGDLPDIMYVPKTSLEDMIDSNMLLNLDDYLDDMPHAQAYEPLGTALNYVRQYKSSGTGSVYGLPTGVGESSTKYAFADSTDRNALKLNWEVYEQIGAPKINDIWDVIDVMEQMMQAKPTADDGNPMYGTVLNSGSDTQYWYNMTLFYRWFGYIEQNLPYLLETNMVEGTSSSILSKDSKYYEGLKWYNEVYRRGLMDPDSINNDRPTQAKKVQDGYVMIPSGSLPGWSPNYYEYYIPDSKIYYSYNAMFGDQLIGINAETENVDACLKFLDMLCDPDASLIITAGPDGDFWYSDEEGNAFFTDAALEFLKNSAMGDFTGFSLSTGEELELWNTPWVVSTGALTSYKDGNGNYRINRTTQWDENNEISSSNETFSKWQATTGYEKWQDWLTAENAFYPTSKLDQTSTLVSIPDDSMQLTIDAIRDTVVAASWNMVYAESEDQFDTIWDKMVKDCEGLGAQEVMEWRLADIENAVKIRDSLIK